jgi:spore germination protein YaaH
LYCLNGNSQLHFKHDSDGAHHFFGKLKKYEQKLFSKKYHDSILKKANIPVEIPNAITPSFSVASYSGKTKIVFGWHCYWNDDGLADYNYKLLTHISYFSCDIDVVNGKLKDKDRWDKTKLVDYAKAQNPACKVLLTITCFGSSEINQFLKSEDKQNKLITELYQTITAKKADGVCLDMEGIMAEDETKFELFVGKLKSKFKTGNLQVFTTLPAIQSPEITPDFKSLSSNIDAYIIMAYDYFGSFSKDIDGPIAPLKYRKGWINECVQTSVNFYLNVLPDSLLVLGVPYFGAIWEVDRLSIPGKPLNFVGYRSFSSALSSINSNKFVNDTSIGASYYAFETAEKKLRHYWMETEYTMASKYDYAIQKDLKGIAIFALGFDYGSNELWDLINKKFYGGAINDSTQSRPKDTTNTGANIANAKTAKSTKETTDTSKTSSTQKVIDTIKTVLKIAKEKPYLCGLVLFSLLSTILIMLVKVVINKENAAKLKANKTIYLFYFTVAVISLILIGSVGLLVFKQYLMWYFVALFVMFSLLLLGKYYIKNRNQEMP